MSEQQKATQDDSGTPDASSCCADMMEKMLGQQKRGGCAGIMAKMMEVCCGEMAARNECCEEQDGPTSEADGCGAREWVEPQACCCG